MQPFLKTAWIVALLSAMTVSAVAHDDADKDRRTISVTGEGKVSAPPDMATINTGVLTQAATAKDALRANSKAMGEIMAVLKEHKIAAKDVQTSNFNVSPIYKRDNRGRLQNEIEGYRVQNQVRVRVRELPNLGEVLDALVQAGSNQVSGISFGVDDPEGILNQARSRAIRNAKSRAEVYAQAGNVKVGKIRQISETPVGIPQPRMLGFARAEAAAAVPVAPGEQEFTVSVHVVYDLADGD
jgi:uncharacterized protein YggE